MTHPLAALIAGVKVKPLVWWEPSSANNWTHGANCLFGTYYVHIDGGRHQAWLETHVQPYENTIGEVVGDLWAAKAAAQADYEARILAALEAAPVPDLVEAGKANIADLRTDVATLRAMQAEREAALQELRFHVDDAVKAWNAHEAAEATVASLQAQVEAMRGALEQIAWSNDSKWQADCARAALEGKA